MKLIILDRDGVINKDSKSYIKSPQEWTAIPGSLEAIARLSRANWKVVIATNQSGIARNLFDANTLHHIHQKMRTELAEIGGRIDSIFVCPHGPDDGCNCRKPKPGMFTDIAFRYDTSLSDVPAVGDSLRDLQASAQAGCKPYLVLTGNGQETKNQKELPSNVTTFENLAAVASHLLGSG